MPVSKYSKKYTLKEFNLEDEFEKDKKAMGLEGEDVKSIPTSKSLAVFYKDEKDYKYYIKDGKWRGIIVKNNKEFDVMKYPSTVEKLNKEFGTIPGNQESDAGQEDTETTSSSNSSVAWTGSGGYNAANVKIVMDQIDKYSKEKYPALNNTFLRVAILSKIAVECRFKMSREKNYKTVARAKQMLAKPLEGLTDEQVAALIKSPEEFWEYVYGQGLGGNINGVEVPKSPYYKKHGKPPGIKKGLGNDKVGDGYKYRGRGFIQFTGKYQYKKYGKLAGVDGGGNPDSFLEPATSAKLSIVRIMKGIEMFGGGIKDYKDQNSANIAVTKSVAGRNASEEKIARTKSHNENFKIVKKEEQRAMTERKIISEKNLRYLMKMLIKENIDDRKPKTKEEGNKFRKWVNDNIPKSDISDLFAFSSDKKLDLEGSIDNSHFNTAWKEFGEEYLEDSTTANPDDVPGESQTSDYSKGYPDSKDNAAVMNKDEKYRYYVKDIGGKKYWVGITVASGKEHVFKGETKGNLKGVDALNKYFGTDFTAASEPEDTREFDFYPSGKPDKMQPAGRGVPEPYFKFRKGDRNDTSMEIFGMTAGGDIYYTSNTDPDIEKDEAGKFQFVKLNESRSIKKVLINKSGTKARIVLENLSAMKKFDLTKEFMKDLDALGLTDEQAPGVVQAKGGADAKVDSMVQPKADKGKGEKGPADPSIHTFIDENSLPIRFEQIDNSEMATIAKDLFSKWGNKVESNAKDFIRDELIKPANDLFGGNMSGSQIESAAVACSKDKMAWSSWFLNACIPQGSELNKITQGFQQGYEYRGIAYPWSVGNKSRKEIEDDMEGSIGKTMFVMFSREEIKSRSDLDFKEGVLTLNAYKGTSSKFSVAKNRIKHGSGYHMNVITSDGPIGGNRGKGVINNSASPAGSIDNFDCYYALVKVLSNDVPVT